MKARLIDVTHNPEHFNARAQATIPECWEAVVRFRDPLAWNGYQQVRIPGDSAADAVLYALEEFPELSVPARFNHLEDQR